MNTMPAAVLSVLVQARGITATNSQLMSVHVGATKATASAKAASAATTNLGKSAAAASAGLTKEARAVSAVATTTAKKAQASTSAATASARQAKAASGAATAINGEAASTIRAGAAKGGLTRAAGATTAATERETIAHRRNAAAITQASGAVGRFKRGAATALGIGALSLTFGLVGAAKAGADFEKKMDSAASVTGATGKQMQRLERQALDLGEATAFSASQTAEAQIELGKGGLAVEQILGGSLPAALDLAAAGELELAQAATTTVNAMKLFDLSGRDSVQVADMMATAANTTTADVLDFAMALTQGGAAAKQAGLGLNDTMVILEALAESGIKNSDAGTSMKAAILQLLAPTKKQASLARELGLSWVDQNGNMKDAVQLSGELQRALGEQDRAQRLANLKVLAGSDGFRALAALYDAGPAKLERLSKANLKVGTAQDVARKKMDNLSGDADELGGAVETLAIKLESKANPALRTVTQLATQATQGLSNWNLDTPTRGAVTFGVATVAMVVGLAKLRTGLVATRAALMATFALVTRHPLGMLVVGAGIAAGALYGLLRSSDATSDAQRNLEGVVRRQRQALDGLAAASHRVKAAKQGERTVTHGLYAAEERLERVRKTHGVNSQQALRAEAEYTRWKNRSAQASKRVREAEQLHGVELRATKQILPPLVREQAARVTGLQRERQALKEGLRVALDTKAPLAEITKFQGMLSAKSKEAGKANRSLNETFLRASRQVNPQYAEGLRKTAARITALGSSITPSKRALTLGFQQITENLESMVDATGAGLEIQGNNVNSVLGAFGAKKLQFTIQKVSGGEQKKQSGGFIVPGTGTGDTFRTALPPGSFIENREAAKTLTFAQGGLMPVALEPGERVYLPPAVHQIGQRTLEARNSAIPRFQRGGMHGKPQLAGPAGSLLDTGRGAIDTAWDASQTYITKRKPKGGSGGAGFTGPPPGMKQLADNAWVDSHTYTVARYIASKFGSQISSDWRSAAENAAANGSPTSSHMRGTAANPGAFDFVPPSTALQAWVRAHVAGVTENDIHDFGSGLHNHIAFFKLGGLIQALASGGGVVRTAAPILLRNNLDAMSAAGVMGNSWQESGWDTEAMEPGTHNGGLFGFTAPPVDLASVKSYAASQGKPWGDTEAQVQFMLHHFDGGIKARMNASSSLSDTTSIFMNEWERPLASAANLPRRIEGAEMAYKIMGGKGAGGLAEGQETIREAKARKRNYGAQIEKLRQRVDEAKTIPAQRSALWHLVKGWGRVGIFDKDERGHILDSVQNASSQVNTEGTVKVLSHLAKYARSHGEITGRDPENFRALTDAIERAQERGQKQRERTLERHAKARKRKMDRIAGRGNFEGLAEMLRQHQQQYDVAAQDAERLGALEPENLTDGYVGQERGAWSAVLDRLGGWRGGVVSALTTAQGKIPEWQEHIAKIKGLQKEHPKAFQEQKWRIQPLREAITNATAFIEERRGDLADLQGVGGPTGPLGPLGEGGSHWLNLGGPGSRIFDTQNTIRELAIRNTGGGDSAAATELKQLEAQLNIDWHKRFLVSEAQRNTIGEFNAAYPVSRFAGMYASGGFIPPGHFGIAGETGKAEIVEGGASGARVFSPSESEALVGGHEPPSLTIEELNLHEDGRVSFKYEGREFDAAVTRVLRRGGSGRRTPGGAR